MSFKTTYILFAILAGVLGVLALTLWVGPSNTADTDYVLPTLHDSRDTIPTEEIDTVEIHHAKPKDETIVFVRDRDKKTWKMTQPHALRVDKFLIDRVLGQVRDARRYENADLNSDLEHWGLDSPSTTVTIKKGSEREWQLNLGNERPGVTTGVVYVTSSDRPKEPMAVKKSELDTLFKSVNQYRSKDLLAESALNIVYVNIEEPKKNPLILDKKSDSQWQFVKPPYGEAAEEGDTASTAASPPVPKPITGMRDLVKAIEDIRVAADDDFVAEGVEDWAKYGLDKQGQTLRVDIKARTGNLLGGDDKKEPGEDALVIGKKADEKGEKVYARLVSENAVVKVAAKNIEPILKLVENPEVLRNRDLVQVDAAKTDAINITNAEGVIKLRKPLSTWQLYESGKLRNADDQTVQALLTALNAKRQIKEFPDPAREKEFGFDKPDATVSVWVDGLEKDAKKEDAAENKEGEKAKDPKNDATKAAKGDAGATKKNNSESEPKFKETKPVVKVTFGKREKGLVYVRREKGGEILIAAVPDTLIAKLSEGPLAYLDRNLPSFSENADVSDLLLDRSGQIYEVIKEKDSWKLKLPKDLAGRNADAFTVDRMVKELRELHTDKLVSEKVTASILEQYGLKNPQLKATVKVQDKETKKTEDWTYLFGKEAADKSGIYAKQEKHDLIFLVRSPVLDALRGDLRDPTVFQFSESKVKGLKLTGWKQVVGSTFTLNLERKADANWVVKAPADFDLDGAQVQAFLATLASLKAERFTARQPDVKIWQLQVEIAIEGEKIPLQLMIGELDAKEKAYYAQSSTMPQDAFLLPQAKFEKVLAGARHFSKTLKVAK